MNTDQFNKRMNASLNTLNMLAKKLEGATSEDDRYPIIDFTPLFAEYDKIVEGLRRSRSAESISTPEPEAKPLIQLINTGGIAR